MDDFHPTTSNRICLPIFHIPLSHSTDLLTSLYLDVHHIAFLSFPGCHSPIWDSPLVHVPYYHPEFCPELLFLCVDLNSYMYPNFYLWHLSFKLIYQTAYVYLNSILSDLLKTNTFTTGLPSVSSVISAPLLLLVSFNGPNHLCCKYGN